MFCGLSVSPYHLCPAGLTSRGYGNHGLLLGNHGLLPVIAPGCRARDARYLLCDSPPRYILMFRRFVTSSSKSSSSRGSLESDTPYFAALVAGVEVLLDAARLRRHGRRGMRQRLVKSPSNPVPAKKSVKRLQKAERIRVFKTKESTRLVPACSPC